MSLVQSTNPTIERRVTEESCMVFRPGWTCSAPGEQTFSSLSAHISESFRRAILSVEASPLLLVSGVPGRPPLGSEITSSETRVMPAGSWRVSRDTHQLSPKGYRILRVHRHFVAFLWYIFLLPLFSSAFGSASQRTFIRASARHVQVHFFSVRRNFCVSVRLTTLQSGNMFWVL